MQTLVCIFNRNEVKVYCALATISRLLLGELKLTSSKKGLAGILNCLFKIFSDFPSRGGIIYTPRFESTRNKNRLNF